MIRAVLFDMDGTLLDTERFYRRFWTEAMEELGVRVDIEHFFVLVSGTTMSDMKQICLAEYGADFPFDEIRARRGERLRAWRESNVPPLKPGVPHIFEELRRQGIRLALATSSGKEHAQVLLKSAGLESAFDACITGDAVKNGKPHPEIFLRAAEALGVPAEECVVVEDSRNGVLAGVAAGAKTVMVPDLTPVSEDLLPKLWAKLDTLEALPSLIENYNLESENT